MKKIKIVALFGQAGSGKDACLNTILRRLDLSLNRVVLDTTRPIRKGYEADGLSYNFISKEEYERKFHFASSKFNNWYYGLAADAIRSDKVNIGVFSIDMIKKLKKSPYFEVYPILVKAADSQRLTRQITRQANPDCAEICRRFLSDEKDFSSIDFSYDFLYNYKEDIEENCFETMVYIKHLVNSN